MSESTARIASVQIGQIAPLGPDAVPSGFVKRAVTGPVKIHSLNVEGDAQADLSVHGGPDKAVYAYAQANYEPWQVDHPSLRGRLEFGAFGENLTIAGMTESDLCLGDVHAIGKVQLQVTQPRQPCFKFALRFNDKHLPKTMVRAGRSGWYYRVLGEGVLQAGDDVRLLRRPNPQWTFERVVRIIYGGRASAEELQSLAKAEGVAEWIRTQLG